MIAAFEKATRDPSPLLPRVGLPRAHTLIGGYRVSEPLYNFCKASNNTPGEATCKCAVGVVVHIGPSRRESRGESSHRLPSRVRPAARGPTHLALMRPSGDHRPKEDRVSAGAPGRGARRWRRPGSHSRTKMPSKPNVISFTRHRLVFSSNVFSLQSKMPGKSGQIAR